MQTYSEITDYFKSNYSIEISGFEGFDLGSLKQLFAGFDDMIRIAPDAGTFIRKIVFDAKEQQFGRMSHLGVSNIGKKGVGSYSTGLHEAVHAVDLYRSKAGTNSYADNILKTARAEMGLRKNYKEYKKLAFSITGDYPDSQRDYEVLAYSIETELAFGNKNLLSTAVLKAFLNSLTK